MRRHTNTRSALCASALLFAIVSAACSGAIDTGLADGATPDASAIDTGLIDGATPDASPTACIPGLQYGCTCNNGRQGTQVCVADGSHVGACSCDLVDSGPIDDASSPDVVSPPHDGGPDAHDAAVSDASKGDANDLLDAGCTEASAVRQPTYLLIVLDGSGSMSEDNKWTGVTPALDALFDDIKTQDDKSLGVGLIVFSDSLDPTAGVGPYPSTRDIAIGYVDQAQHDALRARVDTAQPTNATPTYAALTGGYGVLESLVPAAPLPANGKKVLVLITDGVPTSGTVFDAGTEQDQCVAAAGAESAKVAPTGPITTFVVGTGAFPSTDTQSYDPAFLGQLANAGGAAPQGCTPTEMQNVASLCYFQVTPNGKPVQQLKSDFLAAIDKIRSQITSCEFQLPPGAVNPQAFNVALDDGKGGSTIVLPGAVDGWTFDNPLAPKDVILHGASCTALRANAAAEVRFLEGCPSAH